MTRVVTKVQTNGFYSKIKDQPEHKWSICNDGKGIWTPYGKAGEYNFTDSSVQVLDTRIGDGSVLYEIEIYGREIETTQQKKEKSEMNDWERLRRQVQRYKEQYPPGTRIMLLHMEKERYPVPDDTRGTVTAVDDVGKITIIRHAQTECNVTKTFMGVADIPLLPESIEQAKTLSDHPLVVPTEVCYTSPLMRARQTAEAIFSEVPIIIDKRIIERDLGDWAGMKKNTIMEKYSNAFYSSGVMDFYYTPEGGEPYKDMVLRVADFLIDISSEKRKICIVTHNGVYRVMRSLITGDPLSKVFDSFEPYLSPSEYDLTDSVVRKITEEPLYTVDD